MGKQVGVMARVIPEPGRNHPAGMRVISLVLEPDDATEAAVYSGAKVDFESWPSSIFRWLKDATIELIANSDEADVHRAPIPAIPLTSNPSDEHLARRDQLWRQAIGPDVITDMARSGPLFESVETIRTTAATEARRSIYIHASPVDRLEVAAAALTSASVFLQMAAHNSADRSVLAGPHNPLAPSSLQSQSAFSFIPGLRPDSPAEGLDVNQAVRELARKTEGAEALNEDLLARLAQDDQQKADKTAVRTERFGLVNPDPEPRIAPFTTGESREPGISAARAAESSTSPIGRISAAMRKMLAVQMAASKVTIGGRQLYHPGNRRTAPPEQGYFEAAMRAFLPNADKRGGLAKLSVDFNEANPLADISGYVLAMQPDTDRALATVTAAEDPSQEPQNLAMRAFYGVLAHPQLAAFFGIIVDVAIPADHAALATAKFLRARITKDGNTLTSRVWTAVRQNADVLEVRPRKPDSPDAQCSDGLLTLGNTQRFGLVTMDANAAIDGLLNAGRSDYQSKLDGATNEDLSSSLPGQRGVGIGVIDRWRREAGADEANYDYLHDGAGLPTDERVLYFEDLLAGYRFDVKTQAPKEDWTEWHSLMDRVVHFPEVEAALAAQGDGAEEAFNTDPSWGVDRLGGTVRPMPRDVTTDDPDQQSKVVFETIAVWRNWSLAVPRAKQKVKLTSGEIQLDRSIELKDESLVTMRYRDRVAVAARAVFINGSSLRLRDAAELYDRKAETFVLSKGAGISPALQDEGYPLLRHEPLATPRVYIPGPPTTPQQRRENREEPNRHIIVRSDRTGAITKETDSRIVLPGEATFDMAELYGVLDAYDDIPPRPYTDLELNPKLGTAPERPGDPDGEGEKLPSFPDPGVSYFALAFTEDGRPAKDEYGYSPGRLVDLFPEGAGGKRPQWPNAAGLSLDLTAVSEPTPNGIVGAMDQGGLTQGGDGLIHLPMRLAPAEQIDLAIWSLPNEINDYLRHAPFVSAVRLAEIRAASPSTMTAGNKPDEDDVGGALSSFIPRDNKIGLGNWRMAETNDGPPEIVLLGRVLKTLPIPSLSSYQTVRLIHAVERPLGTLVVPDIWAIHEAPVLTATADHEADIRAAWAKELGKWQLDAKEAPSTAMLAAFKAAQTGFTKGSKRVFLGGNIDFHRKSTVRLDLMGDWSDYRDDIAPRWNDERRYFEFKPEPHREVLATLEAIAYRGTDTTGIAYGGDGRPTHLGHTFPDTRARQVTISARAISRFRDHFTSETNLPPDDPQFSKLSAGQPGGEVTVVIRSTERPKPLGQPACAPSLHYDHEVYSSSAEGLPIGPGQRHSRTVKIRLDLGDRFYASGFDERVGIVCWPPDLFDAQEISRVRSIKVDDIDPAIIKQIVTKPKGAILPEGAAEYVTRWGRDPIHDSGDLTALIPGSAFRGTETVSGIVMPLRSATEDADGVPSASLKVALALYRPILDRETGRFYVDVEIDQHMTYEPWVRLGIVRYQANSLTGLECSVPDKVLVRIPADRELQVELSDLGRISLRYRGVGYWGLAAPQVAKGKNLPFDTPTLDVLVLKTPVAGISGVPMPLAGDHDTPADGRENIAELRPRIDDGQVEWVVGRFADDSAVHDPQARELMLPTDCDPADITILLTECEHYAADDPRADAPAAPLEIFVEPLEWINAKEVDKQFQTIRARREVSRVHIRLKVSPEGSAPTVSPVISK